MGHDFFRAVIRHRNDAAAIFHEGSSSPRDRNQRINAYVMGDAKTLARCVEELALQFVRRRKRHTVYQNVQLAITLFELAEQRVDVAVM